VITPGWPAALFDGRVGIRPLRMRDGPAWVEIRMRNEQWLVPWEPTPPGSGNLRVTWQQRQTVGVFVQMLRALRTQARAATALPFAITYDNELAGQLTISTIVRGAFESAHVGYWIDEAVAGRGVMPTALALATDHCFGSVALHRLEAHIRPENAASRRVVEKLGWREEGLQQRYLAIDGAWRDHIGYAVTSEDVATGMLRRWHRTQEAQGRLSGG